MCSSMGLEFSDAPLGNLVSLSSANITHERMNCRRWFLQFTRRACSFEFERAGSSKAARIAMIAITTSNSINVNARDRAMVRSHWQLFFGDCGQCATVDALVNRLNNTIFSGHLHLYLAVMVRLPFALPLHEARS
jgi:hypothetical protein